MRAGPRFPRGQVVGPKRSFLVGFAARIHGLLAQLQRLYLRRKLGPPVIVVSGLPRSGTSMMVGILGAAGLEIGTDRQRSADEDNPRGYFELERIKDLDRAPDKAWLREYKGKVVKIISFLLKDLPDDLYYQTIFMCRDLGEVVASQNKMLVRRGEAAGSDADDERAIGLYRQHLRKVELLLAERANFARLDVDHRAVLADPRTEARRVGRFLGRALDVEKMAAAVDERLYRNRAKGA